MAINNFDLEIFDTKFTITVDEDLVYLNDILGHYRAQAEKTREMFNLKEPINAAILTGFLLCEELYNIKKQTEELMSVSKDESQQALTLTNSIIERIDKVLEVLN